MNKLFVALAIGAAIAVSSYPQLMAQPANQPAASASASAQDIAARTSQLNALFNEIWQDKLQHNPEYATYLGDKRYDDQLTDYSPRAYNESLARGRAYILRLGAIDTTGLPH